MASTQPLAVAPLPCPPPPPLEVGAESDSCEFFQLDDEPEVDSDCRKLCTMDWASAVCKGEFECRETVSKTGGWVVCSHCVHAGCRDGHAPWIKLPISNVTSKTPRPRLR